MLNEHGQNVKLMYNSTIEAIGAGIDDSGRFWALEGYAIIAYVKYSRKSGLEQKMSNKAPEKARLKMHIFYRHTCLYVFWQLKIHNREPKIDIFIK